MSALLPWEAALLAQPRVALVLEGLVAQCRALRAAGAVWSRNCTDWRNAVL